METNKYDRRKLPRKPHYEHVFLADLDNQYLGYSHNISAEGMYIRSKKEMKVGSMINISFWSANDGDKYINTPAEVVRTDSSGLAVHFDILPIMESEVSEKLLTSTESVEKV